MSRYVNSPKVSDCLYPSDLACLVKISAGTHLKILTPTKTLQRLPIALAQVKAGNTSENLLNKIQ